MANSRVNIAIMGFCLEFLCLESNRISVRLKGFAVNMQHLFGYIQYCVSAKSHPCRLISEETIQAIVTTVILGQHRDLLKLKSIKAIREGTLLYHPQAVQSAISSSREFKLRQ